MSSSSLSSAVAGAKASSEEDEEDVVIKQFKIILLGDGAVGKTSIANRFTDDKFSQNYKQTVGVDFFIKRINLPRKIMHFILAHFAVLFLTYFFIFI